MDQGSKAPLVVAAIPAYNEESSIARVIARALRHVAKVLVVDDGSSDDTALIAEGLGAKVVRNERNLGKGAALHTCLDWARNIDADVLVTLDADGQHDAYEIPKVIKPILDHSADLVIGSRRSSNTMPRYRHFGGRLLDHTTGVKANGVIVDAQSGFRAYSRKAIAAVTVAEQGMGADSELLIRARDAGLRIVEVPVTVSYSGKKTSTHNPVYHWLDVFFSLIKFISIRHPLLFYGGFSLVMLIVAVFFGIQTLNYYNEWGRVVTNLALVAIGAGLLAFLAFFTGIILFTIITVLRERR